jgi:hypothetical protein
MLGPQDQSPENEKVNIGIMAIAGLLFGETQETLDQHQDRAHISGTIGGGRHGGLQALLETGICTIHDKEQR